MEGHGRYRIGTETPIRRRPILLDRFDLILAGSFDPYYSYYCYAAIICDLLEIALEKKGLDLASADHCAQL